MDTNNFLGFQWDEGNAHKNWVKHRIDAAETEQVFKNKPNLVFFDDKHSNLEHRYHILGKTDSGKLLFVTYTIRDMYIRVISARPMNKKERRDYEQT